MNLTNLSMSESIRQLRNRREPNLTVGYALLIGVVENKDKNQHIYQMGNALANRFRQLETDSMTASLEKLVAERHEIKPLPDQWFADTKRGPEIYHVKFVCDAASFLVKKDMSDLDIAKFLGSSAYQVLPKAKSRRHNKDTRIQRDFLDHLRNKIADQYNILLT